MVRKTSEMVEAGILAAIAVLFAILGTYLPVLGVIFNFLWAVPVAVCGMRNGLRWSIMTLIVAGAVIGSLLGRWASACTAVTRLPKLWYIFLRQPLFPFY